MGSFVAIQIRAAMRGLYLRAETKTRQNSMRMKSVHPDVKHRALVRRGNTG